MSASCPRKLGEGAVLSCVFCSLSSQKLLESPMRPDKFTAKMQEALNASLDLASKRNHSEISNEHFLLALLRQPEGLVRPLLERLGMQPAELEKQLSPNSPVAQASMVARRQILGPTSARRSTPRRAKWANSRTNTSAPNISCSLCWSPEARRQVAQERGRDARQAHAGAVRACAATSASPIRIPRANTRRWKNTAAI